MTKLKGLNFLCLCCFLFLSSSKPSDDGVLNIYVKIAVPHQITGEFVQYEAVVDQSGKFSQNEILALPKVGENDVRCWLVQWVYMIYISAQPE